MGEVFVTRHGQVAAHALMLHGQGHSAPSLLPPARCQSGVSGQHAASLVVWVAHRFVRRHGRGQGALGNTTWYKPVPATHSHAQLPCVAPVSAVVQALAATSTMGCATRSTNTPPPARLARSGVLRTVRHVLGTPMGRVATTMMGHAWDSCLAVVVASVTACLCARLAPRSAPWRRHSLMCAPAAGLERQADASSPTPCVGPPLLALVTAPPAPPGVRMQARCQLQLWQCWMWSCKVWRWGGSEWLNKRRSRRWWRNSQACHCLT